MISMPPTSAPITFALDDTPVEFVTYRLTASARVARPELVRLDAAGRSAEAAAKGRAHGRFSAKTGGTRRRFTSAIGCPRDSWPTAPSSSRSRVRPPWFTPVNGSAPTITGSCESPRPDRTHRPPALDLRHARHEVLRLSSYLTARLAKREQRPRPRPAANAARPRRRRPSGLLPRMIWNRPDARASYAASQSAMMSL